MREQSYMSTLKMGAAYSSKPQAYNHKTTWGNKPKKATI